VFASRQVAEDWIKKHGPTGVLTLYPIDTGVYEWAVEREYFTPKKEHEESSEFIGRLTTASQEHYHYADGERAT
jgi:hypothetical protein